MKRIDIVYGGQQYSVGGRDLDEILDEITAGIEQGGTWLRVNAGEGIQREALLLVAPGVPVAVIPIPAHETEQPGGHAPDSNPDDPRPRSTS